LIGVSIADATAGVARAQQAAMPNLENTQ